MIKVTKEEFFAGCYLRCKEFMDDSVIGALKVLGEPPLRPITRDLIFATLIKVAVYETKTTLQKLEEQPFDISEILAVKYEDFEKWAIDNRLGKIHGPGA
jgi:hypothetical protein